jgi:putative transposase
VKAAKRFFRKLLKGLQYVPRVIVTDKLRSYAAMKREIMPDCLLLGPLRGASGPNARGRIGAQDWRVRPEITRIGAPTKTQRR